MPAVNTPQLIYLGFIISKEGISTDPEKIQVIDLFPQLCKRLGRLWCSVHSIADFGWVAKIAAPLHALMGGQSKVAIIQCWGTAEAETFKLLKTKLTQAPILKSPAYGTKFVVETDASFEGRVRSCVIPGA